jgi:predicted RNA-binding Zn-ribbon protein involved in translation (DUF1610 family)
MSTDFSEHQIIEEFQRRRRRFERWFAAAIVCFYYIAILIVFFSDLDSLFGVPIFWHWMAAFLGMAIALLTATVDYKCPQCGEMPIVWGYGDSYAEIDPKQCGRCHAKLK